LRIFLEKWGGKALTFMDLRCIIRAREKRVRSNVSQTLLFLKLRKLEEINMRIAAKLGLFAGGVLFGTAGIRILSSREAKKVYTHATAAVLRAKEDVMTTVTTLRENCGDILADAKAINEERAAAACEEIADTAEEPAAEPAEA
jgi:hypothetical protein